MISSQGAQPALSTLQPASALDFSFGLFQELSRESAKKNLIMSPLSTWLLLALLREGSTDVTRLELSRLLGIGIDADVSWDVERLTGLQMNPSVTLNVANGLWLNPEYTVVAEFVSIAENFYRASVESFGRDGTATVSRINEWVSAQTNGKIPSIVERLNPESLMVAVNAVYFLGDWERPFDSVFTRQEPFHLASGASKEVEMMHETAHIAYFEDGDFQMVSLPYSGQSFVMYVALPKQGIFSGSLPKPREKWMPKLMDPDYWMRVTARFKSVGVQLSLPKFKMESEFDLVQPLESLGVATLFDRARATLTRISAEPPPPVVDQMRHKAYAEITEKGTEAAAASFAGMVPMSSAHHRPPPPVKMVVDRPFAFVIQAEGNPLPLFVGMVEEP